MLIKLRTILKKINAAPHLIIKNCYKQWLAVTRVETLQMGWGNIEVQDLEPGQHQYG